MAWEELGKSSVTLSGSKEELKKVLSSQSTTIPATNGTGTVEILADAGKIGEVYHWGVNIPAIAGATGNHELRVYYQGSGQENMIFDLVCAATQSIRVMNGIPVGTYSSPIPSTDTAAVARLCHGLRLPATAGNSLKLVYYNLSNSDQTGTRNYLVNTVQRGA